MVQGEICDIDGTCVDAADDEIFKLTTKGGSLSMEREKVSSPLQLLLLLSMMHVACTRQLGCLLFSTQQLLVCLYMVKLVYAAPLQHTNTSIHMLPSRSLLWSGCLG